MKIYELINWFQINYPQICKNLKECNHNHSDTTINPYHIESDCWSHTMMVCKIAEIHQADSSVLIAALLHDIGKPESRSVNPKNNHVNFYKHESISAYNSLEILYAMLDEEMINKTVLQEVFALIALHSTLHKVTDLHELFNIFKNNKTLFIKLVSLSRCDNLGRFSADAIANEKRVKSHLNISKNMNTKESSFNKKTPFIELLCGVSNSGKSTYIENNYSKNFTGVIISRDALVMKYGKGDSYAECWSSLSANMHNKIDLELQEIFLQAIKDDKNVVIDMMNLSKKSRKKWLQNLPTSYNTKATLFLTPLNIIKKRNASGKQIAQDVIDGMVKQFEYPTYSEVEHTENVFYDK